MEQLILHLIGDYVTQSDWMAQRKRASNIAAGAHALVYSLPFLLWPLLVMPGTILDLHRIRVDAQGDIQAAWLSWQAFAFICGTHFFIDRFGLARYVVWAKNWLLQPPAPPGYMRMPFRICAATGYPPDRPEWLAVWLLIVADNTLHLMCNYAALRWL